LEASISRRTFMALTGAALGHSLLHADAPQHSVETPYKYGKLVLGPSGKVGEYDSKAVDCPFVFHHQGMWYMTFVAFDGVGYQTGLAKSKNLVDWEKLGCILKRDPNSPILKYNVAMNWILRENDMNSPGKLVKVDGKFVRIMPTPARATSRERQSSGLPTAPTFYTGKRENRFSTRKMVLSGSAVGSINHAW
jgi:hypothetical protein